MRNNTFLPGTSAMLQLFPYLAMTFYDETYFPSTFEVLVPAPTPAPVRIGAEARKGILKMLRSEEAQCGVTACCGRDMALSDSRWQLCHEVAEHRGGATDISNCFAGCEPCNRTMNARKFEDERAIYQLRAYLKTEQADGRLGGDRQFNASRADDAYKRLESYRKNHTQLQFDLTRSG